ncbi:MAG TPA: SDR family NAD(P)-dependent oxidoreductase [Kineosporiaceae bacterium]
MDDVSVDGLVAIVTGAGSGLGRAEARALAAGGARVVLGDLAPAALDEVAAEITAAGGEAVTCPGDVGETTTGEALLERALGAFGRLDVLVNNAGVVRDRMIFTMSEQEWDSVIRVHLRGHFVTTRCATAYWRERSKAAGGPVYGRIVNTSSEAFLLGSPGQPNYAAAKAGIVALTLSTARSCARYGVLANAICPRARTAMTADLMGAPPSGDDPMAPERVAPLVAYLASPAASRITGEVFVVHGDVAAVLAPPTVRAQVRAGGDGRWTAKGLHDRLAPLFTADPPQPGFVCEATLPLADSTFGEPGPIR